MSDIDKNITHKIANLANIATDSAQEEALASELNKILTYVEQLSEVDTDNIEPLISCSECEQVSWRKDEEVTTAFTEQVLENAQERKMNFFVVPKVVDNS